MRLFIILILCSLYSSGIAQKKNIIIDSVTKKPVPYATIICKQSGFTTMANDKGEWFFPDSTSCNLVNISCAGYTTAVQTQVRDVIILSPFVLHLADVIVGGRKEEIVMDNVQKTNCSYGFNPEKFSATYGAFLPNPLKKAGWIKELSFHVSSFHRPDLDVPVRIRFFEWNEITQLPGEELSKDNLILKPYKRGWNKINLEKTFQDFPTSGVVIAFELLSAGPEHYHEYTYTDKKGVKQKGKYYGWNLTASCCSDCEVKGFHYVGNKWILWKHVGGKLNWAPAVKLKIIHFK